MQKNSITYYLIALIFWVSCEQESHIPRPSGYFRIQTPNYEYILLSKKHLPFESKISSFAIFVEYNKDNYTINYPDFNGKIYLSYKKTNSKELPKIIEATQKITDKHTLKATFLEEKPWENIKENVFGTMVLLSGDVASATQFYLTDKSKRFLYGTVYFDSKAQADSLSPLIQYLRKDVQQFIENFKWKP